MSSKYEYHRLEANHIRLLELQDADGTARLIRRIISVPFDKAPLYTAISYVWGKDEEALPRDLICEESNSEITVTKNLESALLSVVRSRAHRPPDTSTATKDGDGLFVWADAVCINQSSYNEKNEQVSMMQKIFERAESVHIWLGDEDENTGPALFLVAALLKTLEHPFQSITKLQSSQDFNDQVQTYYRSMGGSGEMIKAFAALDTLLGRAWFTRIWVVQEVAAAQSARVFCGDQFVNWDDLVAAVDASLLVGSTESATLVRRRLLRIARSRTELKSKPDRSNLGSTMQRLQRLLQRHHDSSSTIPHDMIYALRGIAGMSTIYEERQRLAQSLGNQDLGSVGDVFESLEMVDYGRTMEEVYQKVAAEILCDCKNLDLLGSCTWPHQGPETLPSWVPDWSRSGVPHPWRGSYGFGVRRSPYSVSACAEHVEYQVQFLDDAWERCEPNHYNRTKYLGLSGFIVDVIETMLEEPVLGPAPATDGSVDSLEKGYWYFGGTKGRRLCILPYSTQQGDAIGLFEGSKMPLVIRRSNDPEDAIHERNRQVTIWKLLGEGWTFELSDGRAFDINKCGLV